MRKRGDLDVMELAALGPVRGEVELVADGEHLDRVIRDGVLKATVSVDIATADFKAMLVPPRKGGGFRGTRRRSCGTWRSWRGGAWRCGCCTRGCRVRRH